MNERKILLVAHTGRDEVTETARRVAKTLGENGIALRVLSAEAIDRGPVHLDPSEFRSLGVDVEVVDADQDAATGCELVLVLGGDGTFLRARNWRAAPPHLCSESIWAASVFSPKSRPKPSIRCSPTLWKALTASRPG